MITNRVIAEFIGGLLLSGSLTLLLCQTPSASIEQQLRSQYRIASVGGNGVVVRPGTVVVVQKDGITALPSPGDWPCNSYKQGTRIKQSTMCAVNYSISKDQTRPLQVGEKAYLTAIQVKPTEVVFKLQTCCGDANDAPFRAGVSFQFGKGYLDSMNAQQIQDAISEVFAKDASNSTQPSDQSQSNPQQGAQQTPLAGLWDVQGTGAQILLNPDGSFSQHASDGQDRPGHYTVNGDVLVLTYTATGRSSTFSIRGDSIYIGSRLVWLRHAAEAPAPPAPLMLPATYVSAQTATDQLQLNADNSFSLRAAGESYHGTFVVNGNTVDLSIRETGDKTTATIHGNSLTDSNGQAWLLQEQSAGGASSVATFQNEDVIKMVKAGLDDSLIIAKIGSSKCQFDTSTDALIQLKQGGVSAAVLKAIMGAGK
jgi:hypothetical protein